MKERHPDPEALKRFALGEVPAVETAEIERHLTVCSECRDRVDEARDLIRLPLFDRLSAAYDEAFDRAVLGAAEQLAGLREEAARAGDLLAELLREPAASRQRKIREDGRFHSVKLCELLRARSKDNWFRDPAAALTWAELGAGVAELLDPRRYGSILVEDARALSWAYVANALRITSDLWRSERVLHKAWAHHQQGSGEVGTRGELLIITSSLKIAQRRFEEAVRIADRAAALYRSVHETHLEGSTLIKKGMALGEAGLHEEAITAIRSGLSRIDAARDPRLLLIGKHNLSCELIECGRWMEAGYLLEELRPLYQEIADTALLGRFYWLQGLCAKRLGQLARAEARLGQAREAFLEQGLGASVFAVSVDLAEVYAQTGRLRRARETLDEVIPLGEALGLRQETLAARLLYTQAAILTAF
jgi:tetratricopeptide (TPR) repeat protein